MSVENRKEVLWNVVDPNTQVTGEKEIWIFKQTQTHNFQRYSVLYVRDAKTSSDVQTTKLGRKSSSTKARLTSRMIFIFQHCGSSNTSQYCPSSMRVVDAWRAGYTGEGVVATILDDGIETTHPDLTRNYVRYLFDAKRTYVRVILT